ncbi:uncharacterized protein LOC133900698 [Phragmites australis]|uniref:uncharacterized protein LOC133900698 n=1 Tax=Phragmites australis TaxID=29695 RepID=UPI002D771823|nr:uncharacterized protein LOC133900698 [Phragmites australis]
MDDFTFPTLHAGGQCKQLQSAFSHQFGLGSPPPWFAAVVAGGGGEEEDKMDMLWEDFNEELASAPPLCPLSPLNKSAGLTMTKEAWLDDEMIVVDPEKHSGRLLRAHDGRVVWRRRWSLLLMLRLLKKLFVVKKSRNNPRTAPI